MANHEGMSRTAHRVAARGGCCCALIIFSGCAGGAQTGEPQLDAERPFCEGELVDMGAHNIVQFPNLERSARWSACNTGGAWTWEWRDTESDDLVDVEALGIEDAHAFKREHHAIDPVLEGKLAELPGDAMVDVEVWYALDEHDMPSREEQLESSLMAMETQWELERRVLEGATRVMGSVSAEMGSNVIMNPAMAESGRMSAPFLPMQVRASELAALGDLPGVVRVMSVEPTVDLSTEDYFWNENEDDLHDTGFDGSGTIVAIVERKAPDLWGRLSGAISGIPNHQCADDGGTLRSCHCPGGLRGGHSRATTGIVRTLTSSLSFGGFASDARTLMANVPDDGFSWDDFNRRCAANGLGYGQTSFASAITWSLQYGATVFNTSQGSSAPSSSQSSKEILWDFVGSHSPWPLIAAGAGNDGAGTIPLNKLRNGLVVGGADDRDRSGRSQVVMYNATSSKNPSDGWELPHIVAEAENVRSAIGGTAGDDGTSYAAPQIAGLAASLHEWNPNLVRRPEPVIAGMLAGVDENVDEASGGVWPLDPGDGIDDRDGAGLVNAGITKLILAAGSKRNGGNSPNGVGHDYGDMTSSGNPAGTYREVWRARVHPGQTLVAASLLSSTAACAASNDETSCTTNKFPLHALKLDDGTTFFGNPNFAQNYQMASVKNNTSSDKIYNISIIIATWNNMASSRFGVAWVVM